MERIELLIHKLNEQYRNKAAASVLLATTQMIQAEIVKANKETQVLGVSKVEVIVPNRPIMNAVQVNSVPLKDSKEYYVLEMGDVEDGEDVILELEQMAQQHRFPLQTPPANKNNGNRELIDDVPTFFQQNKNRQHAFKQERLNGELYEADKIKINDLTKAVSLADREIFIRDLLWTMNLCTSVVLKL